LLPREAPDVTPEAERMRRTVGARTKRATVVFIAKHCPAYGAMGHDGLLRESANVDYENQPTAIALNAVQVGLVSIAND
jgi:hypothetical protein